MSDSVALVIGYGSIGQRHARLLKAMGWVVVIVTQQEVEEFLTFKNTATAINAVKPTYVVLSNNTSRHVAIIDELISVNYRGNLLVEKPIAIEGQRIPDLKLFQRVGVGYNLRFTSVVREAKKFIKSNRVLTADVYCGSYLPDWRHNVDYRSSSSATIEDGGVVRDLSHELDLALWLFGDWNSVCAVTGKKSSLEIESNDFCSALMQSKSGIPISIHLSYFEVSPIRKIRLVSNDDVFECDLIANTISTHDKTYSFDEQRDSSYIQLHQAMADNNADEICTVEESISVLSLISAIEESSTLQSWIH